MRSMTGYGRGHAENGGASVVVDARAVNHRFLDVHVRMPPALAEHTGWVEEMARKRLERGHVEVTVRVEGSPAHAVRLDHERARAAYRELTEFGRDVGAPEPVPLSLLATVPDLFRADAPPDTLGVAVRRAFEAALSQLDAMRDAEGRALGRDLAGRLDLVRGLVAELSTLSGSAPARTRDRLRVRVQDLLQGSGVALDRERLEHEVVILAERMDVAEELTRLGSHAEQFARFMAEGGGALGRRLEFLLQEMAREANTVASKAADADIAGRVVELKAEIERMREQLQNVL